MEEVPELPRVFRWGGVAGMGLGSVSRGMEGASLEVAGSLVPIVAGAVVGEVSVGRLGIAPALSVVVTMRTHAPTGRRAGRSACGKLRGGDVFLERDVVFTMCPSPGCNFEKLWTARRMITARARLSQFEGS